MNGLVIFLSSFLLSDKQCPTRVVIAAGNKRVSLRNARLKLITRSTGQCLNTLTDDNKDLYIEFRNHPEYVQSLLNIVKNDNGNTLVQVLSCGKHTSIYNINQPKSSILICVLKWVFSYFNERT